MKRIEGYCTLCRSRCGSRTTVVENRVTAVEPLPDHPTGGALCGKGRALPEIVHHHARLKTPLRRTTPKGSASPGWQQISWEEALNEVAEKLGGIRSRDGAEAVAFAVTTPSGTPMVDSFEWVERFIRVFGSPNLIYAVEVCGWHKDYAHELTYGRGIGFPDYANADVIVLWGHNPARTWLAQASRIADARSRGAKVVVIDPKPNGSGEQADLWLRVRPGADGAIAMGAIRHLIASQAIDLDFVRRWTNAPLLINLETGRLIRARDIQENAAEGLFVAADQSGHPIICDPLSPEYQARSVALDAQLALKDRSGRRIQAKTVFRLLKEAAVPYTPDHVAEISWVDKADLLHFYALLENGPKLAYHAWTGVGQHTNATSIERAVASMYALTGAYDRPGGNIWPSLLPTRAVNQLSLLPDGQLEKALGRMELPLGPPARGWVTARDFCRAVLDREPYAVRALMSFGTNFVVSQADAARNLEALRHLDFHVHADIFMNPTAELADIVLPVSLPPEREALKIGFEIDQAAVETVHFRPRMIDCEFDARADYDIVFDLARRLDFSDELLRGSIADGWNWQLAPLGVTVENLRDAGGPIQFPQPTSTMKYAQTDAHGRLVGFPTRSGLVELYSEQLLEIDQNPIPDHVEPSRSPLPQGNGKDEYPLVLTTAKSGWFVHSSYRHITSLRRKSIDPAVEISSKLARSRDLAEGDWAWVSTPSGKATLRVRINDALDDRVVIAEFGWGKGAPTLNRPSTPIEGYETNNVNAILSDTVRDPVSGSVPLRAVTCDIRPHPTANIGRWAGKRSFTIQRIEHEGRDIIALDLAPSDGGALPDYLPGQHVVVSITEGGPSRSYSLTGSGLNPRRLSIAVRRQGSAIEAQEGRSLSTALHGLKEGAQLRLDIPSGIFTPPVALDRPLVFLAAGIGITPFVSVLERHVAEHQDSQILLLHGCRNGYEHPFARRLQELDRLAPGLRRITTYSAPLPDDVEGIDFQTRGRLDFSYVAPLLPEKPVVYICGSPDFTKTATQAMRELGIPAHDVMSEAFMSPTPVPRDLAPQTVRVAGTGHSFIWRPEMGSLLDAALANGVPLPSGCRVGQCESCMCRVLYGEVAHLLGAPGRDADQCLTCQAVPLTSITLAK
ncbi:molybdopterin-dependent oxidoreductase [Paracoccus sp. MC1854]|uniref:molybdopterin-dependent oxidoreductase n=1 Tax=Paracoccus sp. MC1854 TaxID=2760306 RepID=UPI0015FF81E7|nr:molybdopterin-dependent oxidoreductase [Paracoccus sp. MC1854]MBB1493234.1 molybdopterin-dependent oxidoreductase [Paracoccus sp. MC1854]